MAQFARPASDVAAGGWTASPLWSKIDEGAAGEDNITIASADNSAPDNADFTTTNLTDPGVTTGHVLRARWNKSAAGGHGINAVLELWQGNPGAGGSLIATLSVTAISEIEQTSTYTLSGAEAANITDYGDLYLRLSRQGETGGPPSGRRSLVVEFAELETPDAPVFTPITNAFRFYDDDGGEAASTPTAAQDTDISVDVSGGNAVKHLRLRIDETTGGSGLATDDYGLEVSKNGGPYAAITAASSTVRAAGGGDWTLIGEATFHITHSGTNEEVTIPGSPQEGDLVIFAHNSDQAISPGVQTAGYTDIVTDHAALSPGHESGWKIMGATPDSVITFQQAALNDRTSGVVQVWRKPGGTPVDAGPNSASNSSGMPDPPAITTTVANALIVILGFLDDLNVAAGIGAPAGYGNLLADDDTGGGDNSTVMLASRHDLGATTEDPGAFTHATATDAWVSGSIAFAPGSFSGGSQLNDGAATTNRATNGISDPGTGAFVAGEQESANGVIEDYQLTGGDFTEHVWAIELIAADLSDGDTLDFRPTLNGGAPGLTNNVTPRITISAGTIDTLAADDLAGAASVSQPALGQSHALAPVDLAAAAELAQASLGQRHALGAADLDAAGALSQPALTEISILAAQDLASTATAARPALAQLHAIAAAPLAAAGEAGVPVLGQLHGLAGAVIAAAGETTRPAVAESNLLAASDLGAAAEAGSPALAQVHLLSGEGLASPAEAVSPALVQLHVLAGGALGAAATLTRPALGSAGEHALLAADLGSVGQLTQPAMMQLHGLAGGHLASAAELGQPVLAVHVSLSGLGLSGSTVLSQSGLAQRHAFAAAGLEAAAELGRPGTGQRHALVPVALKAPTLTGRAVLSQHHLLTPADLVVSAEVAAALLAEVAAALLAELLDLGDVERFALEIPPVARVSVEGAPPRHALEIPPVARVSVEAA